MKRLLVYAYSKYLKGKRKHFFSLASKRYVIELNRGGSIVDRSKSQSLFEQILTMLSLARCRGFMRFYNGICLRYHGSNLQDVENLYSQPITRVIFSFCRFWMKNHVTFHFVEFNNQTPILSFNSSDMRSYVSQETEIPDLIYLRYLPYSKGNQDEPFYGRIEHAIKFNSDFILFYEQFSESFTFNKDLFETHFKSIYKWKLMDGADRNADQILSEQPDHACLSNVRVFKGKLLIDEENVVQIHDVTASPIQEFVAGSSELYERRRFSKRTVVLSDVAEIPVEKKEKGIFLGGRCDDNWFHAHFDTLIKGLFIKGVDSNIPIFVNDAFPTSRIEYLRQVSCRDVHILARGKTYLFDYLYVLPSRGVIFDTKPENQLDWVSVSPKAFLFFSNSLKAFYKCERNTDSKSSIYLSENRRYRRMINSDQVKAYLGEKGILSKEIDAFFFQNQEKVFFEAKSIFLQGGAIVTNILFCRPGSKIFVFQSLYSRRLNLWIKLGRSLNLDIYSVTGIPRYFFGSYSKVHHSDYYMPKRLLFLFLKKNKTSG